MVHFVLRYTGFTNVLLTVTNQTVYGTRNSIYAHKKSMATPVLIFMKSTHIQ